MPEAPEKAGEVVAAAIDSDSELFAIRAVLSALVPLKSEARSRVLDYVFKRLGLVADVSSPVLTEAAEALSSTSNEANVPVATAATGIQDIRSLTQQKSPKSANEMAALVAYYLSDVAPQYLRKDAIDSDDLKTYFKQAGFKLPSSAKMTLVNAKNSGYLKSVGEGQYKLNPVGYNLVVHNLPGRSEKVRRQAKARKTTKTSSRGR
jgi:hypothetical protein